MEKGEVILYQPNETIKLEVRLEEESVWLTRHQLALLFDRDVKTIGKHVNNALKEELNGFPVVAKFAITANDGKRYNTEHYNHSGKYQHHRAFNINEKPDEMGKNRHSTAFFVKFFSSERASKYSFWNLG